MRLDFPVKFTCVLHSFFLVLWPNIRTPGHSSHVKFFQAHDVVFGNWGPRKAIWLKWAVSTRVDLAILGFPAFGVMKTKCMVLSPLGFCYDSTRWIIYICFLQNACLQEYCLDYYLCNGQNKVGSQWRQADLTSFASLSHTLHPIKRSIFTALNSVPSLGIFPSQ